MGASFVFIMAGGSGERFWPLSRKHHPKQLLRLFSDNCLLGETVDRIATLTDPDRIYILTNQAQVEPTLKALPGFPREQIIAEPDKRDTAPAAALASAIALHRDPDAVLALLPADQLIRNTSVFQRQLRAALDRASTHPALLTLAIPPQYPATGFGYLHLGENRHTTTEGDAFHAVTRFVEKPNLDTAQRYLEDGHYAWNAGIFVWSATTFQHAAARHQPDLAQFIHDFPGLHDTGFLQERFPSLTKVSIDYAIMEKATSVEALRASFDWDDVGSWTALPSHLPRDPNDNTVRGQAVLRDSHNNILFSDKQVIAACGVEDLIIVSTADAVLVCHKDQAQDIKSFLPDLPPETL